MATRVEEAFTEREQKVNAKGEVTEIEIPYIVFEAVNEDAALSASQEPPRRSRHGFALAALPLASFAAQSVYFSQSFGKPMPVRANGVDALTRVLHRSIQLLSGRITFRQ